METLIENEAIGNIDFSEQDISGREYVKCNFENCNFTKTILKNTDFFDCSFSGCNFSLAALTNTGLKGVKFSSCKLMGVDFGACSDFLFSVTFIDSHLDYSSFHKKKMKKTVFSGCSLKEVDFEETDLASAVFKDCDLSQANFFRTVLEQADLRGAVNYSIDPDANKISKAKFTYDGLAGLLQKYNIEID